MAAKAGARILIVDDHQDNVELLQARLEARGYATETATDGKEALDRVAARPPDLILLDVMMPVIDGIEVARRIKNDASLPFIPIIMQTALDATESKVEGLDAGADDYITKPINFAELEARVNSLLRIKALQEDLAQRERQLADMNDRLRHMSQTDALTGLDNRRYVEERLVEMFSHAARFQEPLSCVMCDLDKFKPVNDTYGHQAGDAVLRQFAQILRAEARDIDRVGRYGGEEFILLLPGTSAEQAAVFAERVRAAVERFPFAIAGRMLHCTMSCGAAAWPHEGIDSGDALVKAADDALYAAKEMGRNRVVRYDSEEYRTHEKG